MKPSRLWIAAVLLLGGCRSLGPDYVPPAAPSPGQLRPLAMEATADESYPSAWWTIFQDPLLNQRITEALAANPSLQVAVARLDESRALLGMARAARSPRIETNSSVQFAGESATRTITTPNGTLRYRERGDYYRIPVSLSYELDLWGRVRRLNEAATARLEATTAELHAARLSLAAEVAALHFTQASLARESVVLEQTLADRRDQLSLHESRFKAGLSDATNIELTRTEIATTTVELAGLQRQLERTATALATILGRPEASSMDREITTTSTVPVVPAGLPSAVLQRRPDIVSAERELAARNAEIGVARAAFFPQLTLTGSAGFESDDLSALFNRPSQFWGFGPGVSFTFLDGRRNRSNLEAAEAAARAAHAAYRQDVLTAFREVDDALVDLQHLDRESALLAQARTAAANSRALARERHARGFGSFLDVIDTQRTLLSIEREQAVNTVARALATVALIKALGGGWGTSIATAGL